MSEPAPTPGTPPAADPLAVALSKLDPAPHGFDRDALMFGAGVASKLWLVNFWRAVAAAALAAAATFAALYFTRPTKTEIVYQQVVVEPKR